MQGERADGFAQSMPASVRWLPGLRASDAGGLGEEAKLLAALGEAGLAIAAGWVVPCGGDWQARLGTVLRTVAGAAPSRLRLSPWCVTRTAASRFAGSFLEVPLVVDEASADGAVRAVARELVRVLGPLAAAGAALDGVAVRVVSVGEGREGSAASVEPRNGDPDALAVWTRAARPWLVDRRTMRLSVEGEPPIDADAASRVADLVDRAQLALGRPVEIDWVTAGTRLVVSAVRAVELSPRFTPQSYRRVALTAEDEGTVAPLAVDAIDAALGREDMRADDPRVRRVYARPYRRIEDRPRPERGSPVSPLARAAARATRLARDVGGSLADGRRFVRDLPPRLAALDATNLPALDDAALVAHLRDAMKPVVEALVLLDRARVATLATVPALEAACGPLPRESYLALAAPRATRERRRAFERLSKLARRVSAAHGTLVAPADLGRDLRKKWDETRRALVDTRSLGLDVMPRAYGEDDAALLDALQTLGDEPDPDARERGRSDAARRVRETAHGQPFGRAREAIVVPVTLLLSQLADAKGEVSEALASALLRMRRAGLACGERLESRGVVEAADDALYLQVTEIEEALSGEPGAYAARVRLRREDDARWRALEAPRRLRAE